VPLPENYGKRQNGGRQPNDMVFLKIGFEILHVQMITAGA
jgi:hypothetical protein